ncbi:MAG: AI-2E family transporter, partial [Longicatena sp.]
SFIFRIVVPQVVDSISMLIASIPGYFSSIQKTMEQMILDKDIPQEVFEQIGAYSQQIQETLLNILKHGLPEIYSLATGFASSIANIFLALVIAVYLTVSKNKLMEQLKRFFYAFTSEKVNTYAIKVVRLTNKTFSAFITGQLIEAIIIGVLCYIGCLILRFPYAPILSVIIGCTNVIPIFGAICGVGICALLVAFVSPLQGIFFVIFGICLQQFECNLIYPRVVGTSVGLSGLWVLFAITIGGGLFGFVGMLLGLPTFSVIYFLLRDEMNRRIDEKKHKEREIIESV